MARSSHIRLCVLTGAKRRYSEVLRKSVGGVLDLLGCDGKHSCKKWSMGKFEGHCVGDVCLRLRAVSA